jgi:hypothetical protein
MLPLLRFAPTTALIAALALPLPAFAWGKDEQNFTKGVVTALIAGALINNMSGQAQAQPRPQPIYEPRHPRYQEPVYQPPVYRQPVYQAPVYQQPVYPAPVYQAPVYQQPTYRAPSVYTTPAAQAFNSYSRNERLRIQSTLANYGYYTGAIDGAFGPGTYRAVVTFAQSKGRLAELDTRGGAYTLYDGLIF